MSLHNEFNRSPLGRAAATYWGLREQPGIERLGETLTPVWNPQQDFAFWLHSQWYRFNLGVSIPAAAGEYGQAYVVNPTGSKVLIELVSTLAYMTGAAYSVEVAVVVESTLPAIGWTRAPGLSMDLRRQPTLPISVGYVYYSNDAVKQGTTVNYVRFGTDRSGEALLRSWVIPPGYGAGILVDTVNVGVKANLIWTERPAIPEELHITR